MLRPLKCFTPISPALLPRPRTGARRSLSYRPAATDARESMPLLPRSQAIPSCRSAGSHSRFLPECTCRHRRSARTVLHPTGGAARCAGKRHSRRLSRNVPRNRCTESREHLSTGDGDANERIFDNLIAQDDGRLLIPALFKHQFHFPLLPDADRPEATRLSHARGEHLREAGTRPPQCSSPTA